MEEEEKRGFYKSFLFPAFLLILIWVIKIFESGFHISLAEYGLLPQSFQGLRGIVFSPLLHSDWAHLSANSVPLFILSAGLFYYYKSLAPVIFALCWVVTGLWVWIFASETGVHIGASGVVYALAAFHFTGGILRRDPRMMAFSLLVVFLYGSLVWGIIPDFFPEKNISWESHLLGGLAGIIIAIAYRKTGPQRKVYIWDDEEKEEYPENIDEELEKEESEQEKKNETDNDSSPQKTNSNNVELRYIYKEKEK
jgi:membrane associated rhomboid family serine protease